MKGERGFTLVEVMVAAALVAVGMLTMATMSVSAYQNVDRSEEQTSAVILAQQQVEFLRTQGYASTSLNAGTTTTSLSGSYIGYTRTTTIVNNTPVASVKQITVQVTTPSGRSAQVVSLIAG